MNTILLCNLDNLKIEVGCQIVSKQTIEVYSRSIFYLW